jgi:uncharacterized tellurite resistance protein B-like protein
MSDMTYGDYTDATEYFRRVMTTEQRRDMMAELPQIYVKMFPGTESAVIQRVADRLGMTVSSTVKIVTRDECMARHPAGKAL